jgi:hypothetical protein
MGATSAPKEVEQLVERFCRNRDSYLAGGIKVSPPDHGLRGAEE